MYKRQAIYSPVDEQIVYNQLDDNESAIWSLLLASGYLKVLSVESYRDIPRRAGLVLHNGYYSIRSGVPAGRREWQVHHPAVLLDTGGQP